jgi:hypothetical protein
MDCRARRGYAASMASTAPFLLFLARLRFPQLFLVTATLFVLDLLIPDMIPFVDEILLGLVSMLLASVRKRRAP